MVVILDITGDQTVVQLNSIIACRGKVHFSDRNHHHSPIVLCFVVIRMYACIAVKPLKNVISVVIMSIPCPGVVGISGPMLSTSCKRCNTRKGNTLLTESSIELDGTAVYAKSCRISGLESQWKNTGRSNGISETSVFV